MKEIPGFAGYFALQTGEIISWRGKEPRVLKPHHNHKGYKCVHAGRTTAVHRLVLLAFRGERKPGQQCAHLNGDKNDNRIENLKYVSAQENAQHKFTHGTSWEKEKHHNAKLTIKAVLEIRSLYKKTSYRKTNAKELCAKFGVSKSTLHKVLNGEAWKRI